MTLSEAISVLEKYYDTLYNWSQDSNYSDYDSDMEMTKEKLEILISKLENGERIGSAEASFLKELYVDVADEKFKEGIALIINAIEGNY